ncbi:MAG: GAF domain-containing sensor histidine kinase, partial [Chloroflexota bacterium]
MSQDLQSQYKRIFDITLQLGSTYDHVALLKKIVVAAKELIDVEAASIMLMDDALGQLRFAMSTNINPHEMDELTVPLEGSIAGWIVTHGEPRVIEDSDSNENHFRGVGEKIDFQTRNLLGVPMRAHKDVIGVVQAVNKLNGAKFSDDDVQLLRILASQAAMAIENARMFQQSDFISEMVHELRTPLLALQASTTLLQRKELPEEKKTHIVDTMKGETQRLITLTNDFLDVARLESGRVSLEIGQFEMRDLLVETADMVTAQADQKNMFQKFYRVPTLENVERG